jgi:hypothetical protein
MEEPLATIQPRQGVTGSVEFREFHLVRRGVEIVAGVPYVIICSALLGVWRRVVAVERALSGLNMMDDMLQLLLVSLLIGHRRFQHLDERLQWLQLELNVVQATHDSIERGLDGVPRTGG